MVFNQINEKIIQGCSRLDILSDELIYVELPKIKSRAIVSKLKPYNIVSVAYIGIDSGSIKKDLDIFISFHKNKWIDPLEILKSYEETIDYLREKHLYLEKLINKKTRRMREDIRDKELKKRLKYK